MAALLQQRSTKGASKQRRDNINSEVSIIRSLLPLPEAVKQRLSQLQVMAMGKAFIAKSNLLSTLNADKSELVSQLWDFTQCLPGFLLITDSAANIVYLSDNSVEHLAHSMVDIVSQSESVLSLVHPEDRQRFFEVVAGEKKEKGKGGKQEVEKRGKTRKEMVKEEVKSEVRGEVKEEVKGGLRGEVKVFSCRMGLVKHPRRNHAFDRYKRMKVSGRRVGFGGQGYFVAVCSPHLDAVLASEAAHLFDPLVFRSRHYADMKIADLDQNGQSHLGYSASECPGLSWYSLIHPEDVAMAAQKHLQLMQTSDMDAVVTLTMRVQRKSGDLVWLKVVMKKHEQQIVCWNHVTDAKEVASHVSAGVLKADSKEELKTDGKSASKAELEGDDGRGRKMDRSELMEKLKKKMKRNDEEVEDSHVFWQVGAKKRARDSENMISNFPKFSDESMLPLQSFGPPEQDFYAPGVTRLPAPPFVVEQALKNEGRKETLQSAQEAPNFMLPANEPVLDAQLFNGLNDNVANQLNIQFLNNSFLNTIANNTHDFCTDPNFDPHNTMNIHDLNSDPHNTMNMPPLLQDARSSAWSPLSYTSPSPFSSASNADDLNNQSFFANAAEIKSELPFMDFELIATGDEAFKHKTNTPLAPRSSFPELEACDVDECLKFLEDCKDIKTEALEAIFPDRFDYFSAEEAFSTELLQLEDECSLLNNFKFLSQPFGNLSNPAAGLQGNPLVAF